MPKAVQFSLPLWILLAIPADAYAHVDKVTGQDYQGFDRNDGRGSCCDWHDCRPAFAPIMEQDGEKILDRGGNKFLFEQNKVVKRPSDDGNWHVCGDARTLYCIIAPVETERGPTPFDRLFGWFAPKRLAKQSEALTPAEIAHELAAAPICKAPGQ